MLTCGLHITDVQFVKPSIQWNSTPTKLFFVSTYHVLGKIVHLTDEVGKLNLIDGSEKTVFFFETLISISFVVVVVVNFNSTTTTILRTTTI